MRFGMFYTLQVPRPWTDNAEVRIFHEAIEQVEHADRLGIDNVWIVEHHFQEEYCHSSIPEMFLAACARNTKQIRLGHGIMLMPTGYQHPARAAERITTLDVLSNGRAEWGTGESTSLIELEAFGMNKDEKTAMWREATEHAANMVALEPYPGFKGKYFEFPCRNIVPRPVQTPHPPLWMGCSRRESIHRAARMGLGALCFAFLDANSAKIWAQEYYDIIKSDECVPIGHAVNPNIAMICAMSCHEDEAEATRRAEEGINFWGYAIGFYASFGEIKPGHVNLWDKFKAAEKAMPKPQGKGPVGTPQQIREYLHGFSNVGMDQTIFLQQCGKTRHEHICESLSLFAKSVMPEFKQKEAARLAKKQAELAPYIEKAMARRKGMGPIREEDVPVIGSIKRVAGNFGDRGGSIPIIMEDPRGEKGRLRPVISVSEVAPAAPEGCADCCICLCGFCDNVGIELLNPLG